MTDKSTNRRPAEAPPAHTAEAAPSGPAPWGYRAAGTPSCAMAATALAVGHNLRLAAAGRNRRAVLSDGDGAPAGGAEAAYTGEPQAPRPGLRAFGDPDRAEPGGRRPGT